MCRATILTCFGCMVVFDKTQMTICPNCGDWCCPNCGACLCQLTPSEKTIALAYMDTYERLLEQITKIPYDFSPHKKIVTEVKEYLKQKTTRKKEENEK
jgi:hypothetical protein